jgi:hypothetical protein
MSEIDWSKAPEDAEAASPEGREQHLCWYRRSILTGEVYVMLNCSYGSWVNMGRTDFPYGHVLRPGTPEQPAWSSEGLPPVGSVCEYSFDGRSWHECHVRYVLDNDPHPDADGWKAVVWCPHLKKEQVAHLPTFRFRPIRTPEQIAADERDAAINEMIRRIKDHPAGRHGTTHLAQLKIQEEACADLYDAGYRLVTP